MGPEMSHSQVVAVTFRCAVCDCEAAISRDLGDEDAPGSELVLIQGKGWQIVTYASPFTRQVKEYRCPDHFLTPKVSQ